MQTTSKQLSCRDVFARQEPSAGRGRIGFSSCAVALALFLSSPASADGFCDALKQVSADRASGFASVRGAQTGTDTEGAVYGSPNPTLPGAEPVAGPPPCRSQSWRP